MPLYGVGLILLALWIIVLALWIFSIVDVIRSDGSQVRNLPKRTWLPIVVLVPIVGSVMWFGIGRPLTSAGMTIGHSITDRFLRRSQQRP